MTASEREIAAGGATGAGDGDGGDWFAVPSVPPAEELDGAVTPRMLWPLLGTARFAVMDVTGDLYHSRRLLRDDGAPTAAEVAHLRECAAFLAVVADHADAVRRAEGERRR